MLAQCHFRELQLTEEVDSASQQKNKKRHNKSRRRHKDDRFDVVRLYSSLMLTFDLFKCHPGLSHAFSLRKILGESQIGQAKRQSKGSKGIQTARGSDVINESGVAVAQVVEWVGW